MEFLKKYWFLILFFSSFVGTSAVAQYRLTKVEEVVKEKSESANISDSKIILLMREKDAEIKEAAEKYYAEAKKERDALEEEQKKQTEIRINQRHMKEDMGELKNTLKELLIEVRSIKK